MGNITKETLASGKVLKVLADQFLASREKATLFSMLSCLRDSTVVIPTIPKMSERDEKELLEHAEVGYIFTNKDPIKYEPDTLVAPDGTKWFPVFSSEDEVVGDYKDHNFSYIPITVVNCIRMAHTFDVKGIVLDPFTRGIDLPFPIADIIPSMESKIEKEN